MEKFTTVDDYILAQEKYSGMLNMLRNILLSSELKETVKWGIPTYTFNNKNVVGIGAFKNHVGLWFFQGALINDKNNILRNAQEGKTKAMRQIHYKSPEDIQEKIILEYVAISIENFKSGIIIKPKRNTSELRIPKLIQEALDKNKELNSNFNSLTLGRKREYAEHIEMAKRESTKLSRLAKIIPLILEGKGLYDKYKNC